jgi:hypothetical protein
VAGVRDAALSVAEIADEPLPSTPPLVPRSSIEALQPMRTEMVLVAGRAELISSRAERALLYRATADKAFELGALPDQATGDDVEDISLDLAGKLAASVDTLFRLPSDPLFDEHRRLMQATLDYLREWQIDYLAALRGGNRFRAELLAAAAHTRVDAVQAALGGPLAELDAWVENEIGGLRRDITGARILAP